MTAGITIVNDFGSVQFDENWKNYGFRQKFSVSLTAYYTSPPNPPGYNGAVYRVVTPGSPQLLVACKSPALRPVKLHCYYDAGVWTQNWLFLTSEGSEQSGIADFVIFDAMDGSFSNVGAEIFNAAGERVYHTDAPVMKVGSPTNAGIQPCDQSFAGLGGRDYAPLILANPYVANLVPGSGFQLSSYSLRSQGNLLLAEATQFMGGGFQGLGTANLPGLYAAIDVTGLS